MSALLPALPVALAVFPAVPLNFHGLLTTPTFFLSLLLLGFAYPVCMLIGRFKTERQAAWILTTVASGVMTAASLPFLGDYVFNGTGVDGVQERAVFAVGVNRFFQAYLCADLFLGSLLYRSQMGVLTGWIHHAVYLAITELAIRAGWGHIFCLCACMELPTFLLGLSTLLPRLRSNVLFGLTFFATRIALHLVFLVSYAAPQSRPTSNLLESTSTTGSLVPAGILAFVFPLHAMWFHGCVRGFIKRHRASRSAASVTSVSLSPVKGGKNALTPDIHPDSRSLARHASPGGVRPVWDVTLRLCRLRSLAAMRVSSLVSEVQVGPWVAPARIHLRRPIRPRVMVRRMSDSLIAALPSSESLRAGRESLRAGRESIRAALPSRKAVREVVLDYVGLGLVR
ncbi:hypothetical protein C8R43DRAFT_1211171 [Mycena crocata]|nr:hypothetical protein C8R43DRAFT_1211171 [Mycena crocata]